ncbi:unnamed protein product [Hydatigera taeniaeformis]|uniref:DUF5741 domain-containing protein n=1 Tax=Hydatigena taeniaeformis TaxID=6205 RepID=A0A0R3X1M2_HYDTA|nr:unnamed protein product [Hydatigera taeniaeformis]
MLASLKSENESLQADHEDLITKFQSSEREWIQRYNHLSQKLQIQKTLQFRIESDHEAMEDESLLPESAQKPEISELQRHLSEARSRIIFLETELNAISCREAITVGTETDPLFGESQETDARLHLSPTPSPRIRSNLNTDSSKPLSELTASSKSREYSELLRRHNAARLIIEDLVHKNVSLSKELATCQQDLGGYQSKLAKVSEELLTERALHAENLGDYRKEVQGLQDRITDLLEYQGRCDALTSELSQLKEKEEIFKCEHTHQLQNLDMMLHQECNRAAYDLMTGQNTEPEEIDDKAVRVHFDRPELMEQEAVAYSSPPRKAVHPHLEPPVCEETVYAEEPASEVEDPIQDVVNPLHISGGILDKTIQKLQVALKRLQSEISVMETPELCPMSRGDEGDCCTIDAFNSVDRLKEVRLIIQSLLNHFDNIRAMKLSLSRTINRSLLVNASVEVGCDLRRIHSTVLPLQDENKKKAEDENVLSFSHSTAGITTIEDLKDHDNEAITERSGEATFDISREDIKSSDVSAIEARNRIFFDRVTLAVAKIQDAVEDFSFKAATEVLTALASQPVKDARPDYDDYDYGDYDGDIEGDDNDVERMETRTGNRSRTSSISDDTLNDISRAHTGFSEIAEEEAAEKGMRSKNRHLRCLDPAKPSHDITVDYVNDLLTRFVDMMICIRTQVVHGTGSSRRASAFETNDHNHSAFLEWTSKGREWVEQFIIALQNTSMLSLVQSNLEELEREVSADLPNLSKSQAEMEQELQEKDAQTSQTNGLIPQDGYEALVAKYDRLSVLNVELQNAHVLLLEEWGAARRQYDTTVADLRTSCDELRDELERSQDAARYRSSRIEELEDCLTEANTRAASLLQELSQTKVTITSLQERLEKADTEVSHHRSELEQCKMRTQAVTNFDDTTPLSLTAIFDCLLAGLEDRIQLAVEERKREEEDRIRSLTSSFELKVSSLEAEMEKQVETYEDEIKQMNSKYSNLLESSQSKYAFYEERCETLVFREQELNAELETKLVELEHLRQDYQMLQTEVGILRRRAMNAEHAMSEELAEKARKYPELKAIAMDLKSRLFKRAELLEHSLNEAKRLRRIIQENDARAKEFLEELERLRTQILAKNSSIRHLEKLAQQYSEGRLKTSPVGRVSELDPPKSLSAEHLEKSPPQASMQVTTSTSTNVSGKGEEPDSLCSVTQHSFLIDSTHKSTNTAKTSSSKTPSAITVPVVVMAKEDEVAQTISSGIVYSAPQCIGTSRPLLLDACDAEPCHQHPSSTTAGETISIVDVYQDEEMECSLEGVTQSFGSKGEASLTITISLPSMKHLASGGEVKIPKDIS